MFFKFPLVKYKSQCYICLAHKNDFLAQLVEQLTLNQWVEGSSPSEVTMTKLSKESFFRFTAENRVFP